jgi:hypothetical protein
MAIATSTSRSTPPTTAYGSPVSRCSSRTRPSKDSSPPLPAATLAPIPGAEHSTTADVLAAELCAFIKEN